MRSRFVKPILRPLRNQRGDILIVALSMIVLSLLSSLVIINYTRQVETNSRVPRIKSMMTSLEGKVRSALLSPTSYTGCSSDDVRGGRSTCSLDVAKIQAMSLNFSDTYCPSNRSTCGIGVTVLGGALVATTNVAGETVSRVSAKIKYELSDLNLADIDIVMDVPADILQQTGIYACPAARPKFDGFTADGKPICNALPTRIAEPGRFVSSIDTNNISFSTSSNTTLLPSSAACASNGQFINTIQWGDGGTNFSFTCANRLDPFTTFGFTPNLPPDGDLVYVTNPIQ